MVDKNGVKSAGGYLLNLLPDATEDDIKKIENAVQNCEPISKMLEDNIDLREIAKKVTQDDNIQVIEENIIPVYECNCNKDKFKKGIISLGKKEIEDIIKDQGEAEVICHFCNKKYVFTKEELEEIVEN